MTSVNSLCQNCARTIGHYRSPKGTNPVDKNLRLLPVVSDSAS
jgi:hypothetical protein